MLQCCGVQNGFFILRNYLAREKVEQVTKGNSLERFEFVEDDPALLREKLLAEAAQHKQVETGEAAGGTVTVDQAFNVKGVGTVALGVVRNGGGGEARLMRVLPGEKTAQIRSIQKHDEDFDLAIAVDRVGLALKNVDVEDLERGAVLTTDPSVRVSKELKTRVSLVKFWQAPLKKDVVIHLGNWMQFVPCRVEAVSEEADWRNPLLALTLEKPLVHFAGNKAVVTYLEGGKLCVAGTAPLP